MEHLIGTMLFTIAVITMLIKINKKTKAGDKIVIYLAILIGIIYIILLVFVAVSVW